MIEFLLIGVAILAILSNPQAFLHIVGAILVIGAAVTGFLIMAALI